ncbi:MAG: hypothetical protein JNJ54_23770 [Myxococcaceae bacterium]|nr:hypothetical protein [Myxococcaceae bacterium]
MNAKLAITGVLSALLGVALGYLLFHAEPPPAAPVAAPEPAVAPPLKVAAPVAAPPAPSPAAAPAAPASAAPPQMPPPALVAPPLPAPLPPDVAALDERVRDLERQLAIERAIRRGTEGERIEPPANLAPRFRDEQQLLTTFNQALKAAGFPGQVSNIDCTEHPCIVFGTGFGDRGDMEKLKGQLGPYEEDSFSTYGFGTGDGKKEHRFFGVAVMPSSKGPPDEAVQKRVGFRVNQMHEASKPPKTP